MQATLNSLDGVPPVAEASGCTPSRLHRPEAAQTTCSAGRRRLVMVPSAIIHQHAVEAANGCSWLQPGRGSHQDRTTSRRRQRRKCLRWPEKHRQRLWRLASVDVIELCHGLRCAFSEPSSAAAAMHQLSRYEKTDPLQTRSADLLWVVLRLSAILAFVGTGVKATRVPAICKGSAPVYLSL